MLNDYNKYNYDEWYKLDNAAKIFPAVSNDFNPNVFRICATLSENVDKDVLQQSLEITLPRFPSFAVRMRRGFFWYYLDHNTNKPIVREEDAWLYTKMRPHEQNGYLFRVFYYGRRISLEVFHSLSDGYGAFEFLKSIVYHYLSIKGYPVKAQGMVKIASSPYTLSELEDSAALHYEKTGKGPSTMYGETAYTVDGIPFIHGGVGLISGECPVEEFKSVSKSYGATANEFFVALYIKCILDSQRNIKSSKKPLVVIVPVNLRKFFQSETLRNCSNLANVTVPVYHKNYTLEDLVALVKEQLNEQVNAEYMTAKMSGAVAAERNIFMRMVPLFIKIPVLKIAYKILGEKQCTTNVSNLGVVKLPDSMVPYVEKFDFSMASTKKVTVQAALGTYNGKMVICFTRRIVETDIMKNFFTALSDKVHFTITSNCWEDNYVERLKPDDNTIHKVVKNALKMRARNKHLEDKKLKKAEKKAAKLAKRGATSAATDEKEGE